MNFDLLCSIRYLIYEKIIMNKYNNLLWILLLLMDTVDCQLYSASDRSPQELSLIEWTSGLRMAYCQEMPVGDLVDPFLSAIARMVNRHCHNATACRLQKPVTFTVHNVVLLDNYPRRTNRAVDFKFFVVLPPDAVPLDKKIAKPLLSSKILADVIRVQLSEFTQRLGWQILGIDHYPRFDPITTFMNRALIPIGIIAGIFMLFLAYWSSTMSSSSYSSEGWMVSGSTGGKNAALRRTLEIIQEQKYHQEQERRLQMAIERKEALAYRTALAETGKGELIPNPANGTSAPSNPATSATINNISIESSEPYEYDEDGNVPEIVIMHARDSSKDTMDFDNPYNQRKISHSQGRGKGGGRRLSSVDEIKRKQRHSIFGGSSRPDRQKRWKTGSLMLSHLGSKDGK